MGIAEADNTSSKKMTHRLPIFIVVLIVCIAGIGSLALWDYLSRAAIESRPSCVLTQDPKGELKFVFSKVQPEQVIWTCVQIEMINHTNDAGTFVWWPSSYEIYEYSYQIINSSLHIGALQISCEVRDVKGNGYLEDGDYFTLNVSGSELDDESLYEISIRNMTYGNIMGACQFQI